MISDISATVALAAVLPVTWRRAQFSPSFAEADGSVFCHTHTHTPRFNPVMVRCNWPLRRLRRLRGLPLQYLGGCRVLRSVPHISSGLLRVSVEGEG